VLDRANRELNDRHFAIGPSYFLKKDLNREWVETIWDHSVLPYLAERYFGAEDQLDRFHLAVLLGETGADTQDGDDEMPDSEEDTDRA
jgi:hypothetical protein